MVINDFKQAQKGLLTAINNFPKDKVDKKYTPLDLLKIEVHHYESQSKQILKRY